jgi:lipopolysaccharide assembly outer membrane protein LptD (OstA)
LDEGSYPCGTQPSLALSTLLTSVFLLASLAPWAQVTPIPWHPKDRGTPAKPAAPAVPGAVPPDAKAPAGAPSPGTPPAAKPEALQGKFSLSYDTLTTLEDGVYYAIGNVRFVQQEMILTADAVTYDGNAQTLLATGNVAVDWGTLTVAGRRLFYSLEEGTGWVEEAYAEEVGGALTVQAEKLMKTGEDWYALEKGTFTSCTAAVPPWSMKVRKAKFQVDQYAYLSDPQFQVRNASVLYLPYLIWPLKPQRSTGILIPDIGTSSKKGFTSSTAFFYAPRDWWDDTLYLDYFSKEGFGVGEEFRYALTPRDFGWFHGYYINQRSDGRKRWSLQWTNFQTFGRGWRVVADINYFSDINFPRDYQRDYTKATVPGADSRIFLQREWGPYYFNAFVERRQQYFTDDQDLNQKVLPEVELRSSLQHLGAGLYFGFETSAAALEKDWVAYEGTDYAKYSMSYQRFDAHPFFEWPLHPAPWLDFTPRLEMRATYYSKGVDPGTEIPAPGSFWRTFPRFSADLTGPRLYRNYKGSGLRHIIEPFVQYTYAGRDTDSMRAPTFDEVDMASLGQSLLRYGVRNRLYGKDGELRGEAELYQSRSYKGDLLVDGERTSQSGPVWFLLRAWPSRTWNGELRVAYNPLIRALGSQTLSVTYKPRKGESDDFLRISYYRSGSPIQSTAVNPWVGNPAAEEARLAGSWTVLEDRLTLSAFLEKDLRENRWRQQRGIAWYHGSCFSIGLEGGRREIGAFKETSFRLLISLKGAGTVLDLNGGVSDYGQ